MNHGSVNGFGRDARATVLTRQVTYAWTRSCARRRAASARLAMSLVALLLAVGIVLGAVPAAVAAPQASFTFAPAQPEEGQLVTFSGSATSDVAIHEYDWEVDGSYEGSGSTLEYEFGEAGRYEVSLTVQDENFDEHTATQWVSVTQAPKERVASGDFEARLFHEDPEDGNADGLHPIRLQFLAGGSVTHERVFAKRCGGECPLYPWGAFTDDPSLRVIDLDANGQREVTFDFGWGNICCRATRVFDIDAAGRVQRSREHNWGSAIAGRLRDADSDGKFEWLSFDGRIRYAFGCGGCVTYPVQVIAYRNGRFVDVTRKHPKVVRAQARKMWREVQRRRDPRHPLATWAADQYNLGNKKLVWRVVNRELRRGRLGKPMGRAADPGGRQYVRALRRWLNRNGYA